MHNIATKKEINLKMIFFIKIIMKIVDKFMKAKLSFHLKDNQYFCTYEQRTNKINLILIFFLIKNNANKIEII